MTSALDEVRSALALGEINNGAKQAILSGEAIATEEGRQLVGQLLDAHRYRPGRPQSNLVQTQGAARNFYRDNLEQLGKDGAYSATVTNFPALTPGQVTTAVSDNANGRIVKAAKFLRQN